jgi:Raf kinase inhibitor-like YbhB/YbcL family protein
VAGTPHLISINNSVRLPAPSLGASLAGARFASSLPKGTHLTRVNDRPMGKGIMVAPETKKSGMNMTLRMLSGARSAFVIARGRCGIAAAAALFVGVTFGVPALGAAKEDANMKLTSTAFGHKAEIPRMHTCDGKYISPPVAWSNLPAGTKSLAMIVDDPDAPDPAAPKMTWVHWVLYNISPSTTVLAQGIAPRDLPVGTREGLNDWKRTGYGGPCPPLGRHRYFHRLYALDVVLPDLGKPTKAALEKAMRGHVLAEAQLVGTYQRK